jgi:ATP-binding cassette subfamily B protein
VSVPDLPLSLTRTRRDPEYEMETRPLDFGLIRRLFSYARRYRAKRNWLFTLVIIRSIQLPLLVWATGAVINGPISRGDWPGTIWAALAFAAFAATTHFTFHFRQRLALELGESVVHDLRNEIFAHLLRMPMSFFNRTKLGRIISRVTSDVESVRQGVQDVLFVSMVQAGQMLVAAVLMAWYDIVLFSVMVAMAPILWLLNRIFRAKLSKAHREVQESFSRITSTLAESVHGIRVTQGFVRQEINAGIFRQLATDHSRYNIGVARRTAVFLPLLEMNTQFFVAVLLLLGGYRVMNPDIHQSIGGLIQFLFLANMFFSPIPTLGQQYNHALTAMAGCERVFRLLDTQPDWADPQTARDLPPIQGRVEFQNVWFGYEPGRPVLQDINFTANPGQTIALVGHTGSGKSSIINLIAKFYVATQGAVLIDGHTLVGVKTDSLHRQMGMVTQQNFLFTGTVLDNIRLSKPSASDEEVLAAARSLDCTDLFDALPDGLQTVVGERGTGISLGQRQLVCFTRAMLADPRILILDEATSSVDAMTEARIQKALTTLLKGRTSFVVAHRLSTIRHADLVLVLDQGRIIERGTHNELLEAGGAYAELYRQFIRASEA